MKKVEISWELWTRFGLVGPHQHSTPTFQTIKDTKIEISTFASKKYERNGYFKFPHKQRYMHIIWLRNLKFHGKMPANMIEEYRQRIAQLPAPDLINHWSPISREAEITLPVFQVSYGDGRTSARFVGTLSPCFADLPITELRHPAICLNHPSCRKW